MRNGVTDTVVNTVADGVGTGSPTEVPAPSIATATFTCVADGSAHPTLEALHKHLRTLKITQERYYTEFAPVRDRGTGEPIPYKAPSSEYLKREFISRTTLKKWMREHPEEAQQWALDWLVARKEEKDLLAAPCQADLRSIPSPCPDVRYYDAVFEGGYIGVCAWAGLPARFDGELPAASPLPGPVIIDTREQKPLNLPCASVRGTLRSADYGLAHAHDQSVYIERKSLADLLGTLSDRETRVGDSNLERFTRELERAGEIDAYLVLLVEQKLSDCLAFNSIPYLKRQFGHVKITPEHVFHNLRALLNRFPGTFQPLFVDGRKEAANAVVRLLAAGNDIRRVDLQLAYDVGALKLT